MIQAQVLVTDPQAGPCAYVTIRENQEAPSPSDLLIFLRQSLPAFTLPRDVTLDRIQSRLKGKGADIFDLYLRYGTMTRKQAAGLLGCNDRSHKFSYGMQSLRIDKNEYLQVDGANSTKGQQMLILT